MFWSLTTSPGSVFADFDAIQRQLQQLFDLDDMPSSIRAAARGTFPPLNMGSTDEAVEIYAFAPGLDPAKIEVTLEGGLLTLSGQRADALSGLPKDASIYAQERFAGGFRRVVGLPEAVDGERIQATYRNGVLRIVVPRQESMKPRRIEVEQLDRIEHKQ
jgi:HSP20 family protein